MMWQGSRFAGRSVLVVGGAHGIGRAAAARLAAEGARVVIADREADAAAGVAGQLPAQNDEKGHGSVELDVTRADSVERGVASAAERLGGLSGLVVAAGGDTAHPDFARTGDEVWQRMFELNLLGTVRCARAAIPYLPGDGGGAMVFVSSINALMSLGSEPYAAAKAGLGALVTNLAGELGPQGIRVNAVAPATIRTRVWDGQDGGADRLSGLYPLGRVGEPEDVAAAIAFLASDDAAWITGHTLPVDGGLSSAKPSP